MRGIRGYIRNLIDGDGPPVGTVDVSAIPRAKPPDLPNVVEIDEVKHRLGKLNVLHLPGSSNPKLADQEGFFGWDMELAPGAIDIRISPNDPPPTQHRRRFPDESAQIGKGFITDIERLGWAGGRDHLIWDAVFDGNRPTSAQWSTDPTLSATQGNWSYGGPAADPGRLIVRKGIAMLGGVVFSIEMNDLSVPVAGDDAMMPNSTATDRWDLVCLRMDWNPLSPEYGKQFVEVIQGGATIPPAPGNVGNYRCLPLWAVKMKAGQSVYSNAVGDTYDLRTWSNPPVDVVPAGKNLFIQVVPQPSVQTLDPQGNTPIESALNTPLATSELILPPGSAWEGVAHWNAIVAQGGGTTQVFVELLTEGRALPGDAAIAGTQYAIGPSGGLAACVAWPNFTAIGNEVNNFLWPISQIPNYFSANPRTWSRLRFRVRYYVYGASKVNIVTQSLAVKLWPVR